MTVRKGDWIQTYTGILFYPMDPEPDEVCLEDIAHALSMLCRFGGHCSRYYSVAEHSVYVSRLVPPSYALVGLLHDAAEAYVADVPRPLKRHLPGYKEIEQGVWLAVANRFGLPHELPPEVKIADDVALAIEAHQLMPDVSVWTDLRCGLPADVPRLSCLSPDGAKQLFVERYHQLGGRDRA